MNTNITGVKATLKEAHKQKALGMHPDHAIQLIRTFCRVPKDPGYEPKFVADMNVTLQDMTMLGLILEKSRVPQLKILGQRLLLCSANLGHLPAISRLLTDALNRGGGRLNQPGLLPSLTRLKWYAEAENAEALVLYGRILKAENKLDKALTMFQRAAAAEMGDPTKMGQMGADAAAALVNQGLIYLRRKKFDDAKPCFERAALEGDSAVAYHHLALCLDEGDVLRKTYLEKAAASGVPGAARDLAKEWLWESRKKGVEEVERKEALEWAKQWADIGHFMEDEGAKEVLDEVLAERGEAA